MKPKVLAYYLPAYHRIPENDKWHGEGFTEWVTTKKGKKIVKWQNQPREPLNDNYYNLSKIEDIKWQCELAKKYGVDGFCFYHYWFDGKKIFEKPGEILLNDKTIDINYCFAWANEEWRNTWNDKLDTAELLLAQNYDDPEDWNNHFDYLLKFFQDDRYIKLDNKPVFMIYHIENIVDYEDKFNRWNELARENGFNGIYLLQMVNNDASVNLKSTLISGKVDFEPNKTFNTKKLYALSMWRLRRVIYNKIIKRSFLYQYFFDIVNYDGFYNTIFKKEYLTKPNYFYSAVVDWDNTARKGKRGWIFKGATPLKFGKYFKDIYRKTIDENKSLVFIFAWNEWGEGAYLEPDTVNKYGYLEQIKEIVEA